MCVWGAGGGGGGGGGGVVPVAMPLVLHSMEYGVYISHLIQFARASSQDFDNRTKILTAKLLKDQLWKKL